MIDAPPSVHWLERVPSTQDVAHGLAADGAAAGTAVVAVEQTGGRGSRGRAWASGRGGLWVSIVSRPRAQEVPETLSLRAALRVCAVLESEGSPAIRIKWPNDLVLTGRKVGGILCEARWTGDALGWVVIGVGINVQNVLPAALAATAVSLAERGCDLRPGDLAEPVIDALRELAGAAGPLSPTELAAFASRDLLRGQVISAPVAGRVVGVTTDGALGVRGEDGTAHSLRTGPVVLAGPATPHA